MATAPKQAIASPQIFSTDPIEQIYGKGVISGNPEISGFAGAMLNAANTARERDQATYLDNLGASNRLSAMLATQAEKGEILREAMKQVPHYANAGLQIADFPTVGQVASDPNAASVRLPASLHNAKTQAEINKLNAEAAAKHGEGAPKITSEWVTDNNGQGQWQMKIVGGTMQNHATVRDMSLRLDAINRGRPDPGPGSPGARPGTAQQQSTSQGAVLKTHPQAGQ